MTNLPFHSRLIPVLVGLALAPFTAYANVVGSDAQNFNPTTSGLDFVTVQSSETLEPGVFNLGLFTNYGQNTFPYYEGTGASAKTAKDNALTGGDLNLGVGLAKDWDAGISFPFILNQKIGDSSATGHFSTTGNTEIRVNTKYRLFGSASHGLALVASANFNRIDNNPFLGTNGGPIYNLEVAGDMTISQVAAALNVGRRWRNAGAAIPGSGIEPIPDQWLASGALSYMMESIDTKVIFEILAAFPDNNKLKNVTDRDYTVAEAQLGLKYDATSNLAVHLGGGAGLVKGVASPDYRVYAGLNFSFGPLFGHEPEQKTDPYEESLKAKNQPKRVARRGQQKLPKEIEETPPSTQVETVSEVPVINRGTYNHIVLNRIEFVGNTLELKASSVKYFMNELLSAIRELNHRRPIETIVVEGHTDSTGGDAFNMKISEERAQVVADLLKKNLGLEVPIQAVGLGATSPIADNGNYQGRQMNRRVEFKILYRRSTR